MATVTGPMSKRAVFVHSDGLHQIIGLVNQDIPVTLAGEGTVIQLRDRVIPFASLIKVTERVAFYKEPMIPASYTFDKRQQ